MVNNFVNRKVYLLLAHDYDETVVVAVYSSYKRAHKNMINLLPKTNYSLAIQSIKVNGKIEEQISDYIKPIEMREVYCWETETESEIECPKFEDEKVKQNE